MSQHFTSCRIVRSGMRSIELNDHHFPLFVLYSTMSGGCSSFLSFCLICLAVLVSSASSTNAADTVDTRCGLIPRTAILSRLPSSNGSLQEFADLIYEVAISGENITSSESPCSRSDLIRVIAASSSRFNASEIVNFISPAPSSLSLLARLVSASRDDWIFDYTGFGSCLADPESVSTIIDLGASLHSHSRYHNPIAIQAYLQHRKGWQNCAALVKVLMSKGGALIAEESHGRFPIHLAASDGEAGLISSMANPETINARRPFGYYSPLQAALMTALHEVFPSKAVAVIQALLENGADVNLKTRSGETTLHLAFRHGNLPAFKMLLEHADIDLRNTNAISGFGILETLVRANQSSLVQMVLRRNDRFMKAGGNAFLRRHMQLPEELVQMIAAKTKALDQRSLQKAIDSSVAASEEIQMMLRSYEIHSELDDQGVAELDAEQQAAVVEEDNSSG